LRPHLTGAARKSQGDDNRADLKKFLDHLNASSLPKLFRNVR
jgi:hypothetical protein